MNHQLLIFGAAFLLHAVLAAPIVQAATIQLPRTGQTTSYGPRDDGELQEGVARPDPRFTDNNNGTVTDRLTGLIWLKDGLCFGPGNWANALVSANNLASGACGLTDGSIAGQWRLPNVNELESLTDGQRFNPALPAGHPFGVPPNTVENEHLGFWSSNTENLGILIGIIDTAWTANMSDGNYLPALKSEANRLRAWPVRDGLTPGTIQLPKTGQTISYAAGDDGALEKGVAWPSPRFTDNGNGTVTDNLTGLIWLKNANCFGPQVWTTALASANSLASGACGLGDGSVAGDWRLPNRRELRSLVDLSVVASPLSLPAIPSGHPFSAVQINYYFSSSTAALSDALLIDGSSIGGTGAEAVHMGIGAEAAILKSESHFVWPVRGGRHESLGGVTVWSSRPLAFGNGIIVDPALTRQITLKNRGATSQTIAGITVTGANPADFGVALGGANPCPSLTPTLAPGASCTVLALFDPLTVGDKTANLRVGVGAASFSMPMSGYGVGVTITGWVRDSVNAAVGGVTFTGGLCTTSAVSNGTYSCNVTPGTNVTITPVSALFSFTPASRSYTAVTTDQFNQDFTANAIVPVASLTVTKAGSGTGTVTPSTGVLSFVGNVGTATYPVGTSVTLSPLPESISTFGGWTGPCTLTGTDCTVSMTANRAVTATFTAAPKAKIGATGFTSLNAAYSAAAQGAAIRVLDATLTENLLMNLGKNVSIQGGYNAPFSSRTGNPTLLQGLLTVGTGSLTADGLGVK